ncbi:MAG: TIGR02265 family protein [Myxococcaceae bacterium]|nr:MAG: TIGR02265 family protein [Myxococcaceae bacterium]
MSEQRKEAPGLDAALAQDLEKRLALATPDDTARGMFFNGALNAVRILGGDAAVERCLASVTEKKFVDFFNYPVSGFLKLAFTGAQLMGPQLGGFDVMLRKMGTQATTDFLSSAAGKTLLLLAGDSPKRLVTNLPTGYRAAVSYGERSVDWSGDRTGRLIMKRDFMPPAYHEGVLQAVIEALGARGVQVQGKQTGPVDTEYALSWQ